MPDQNTPKPDDKAAPPTGTAPETPKKEDPPQDSLTVDIKAAIEKARTQEKSKLRDQMAALEAAKEAAALNAATLSKQVSDLTAALAALKQEPAKKDEAPAAQQKPEITQDILTKAVESALKRAEETIFSPQLMKLEEEAKALRAALEKRDLDAYRNQLIESNKDSIVPELVTGTTREEIDTSLVQAKQTFAKIAQALAAKMSASGTVLPPAPKAGTPASGTPSPLSSVSSMSQKDYAQRREELLRVANAAASEFIGKSQTG